MEDVYLDFLLYSNMCKAVHFPPELRGMFLNGNQRTTNTAKALLYKIKSFTPSYKYTQTMKRADRTDGY